MKTAPLLLAMAAIAAATTFLAAMLLRPAPPAAGAGQDAAFTEMQQSLEQLRRDHLALQKEIAICAAPPPRPARG